MNDSRSIPVGAAALLVLAVSQSQGQTFTDVTDASGLDCPGSEPYCNPDPLNPVSFTGGGVVADFDGNGFQDIFLVASGSGPDRLYLNDGTGSFTESSQAWGVDDIHRGIGASAADYDHDGDVDLFVASFGPVADQGPGQHRLYRNDGGHFANVALAAGVHQTSNSGADGGGSAWGDYDGDGDLDLFVTGYFPFLDGSRLFENLGDGTFADVTNAAGLGDLGSFGFGPAWADMTGDGRPDLLIAADFGTSRFLVNGSDGLFEDRTVEAGTGLDGNGMGHAIGDFDNNGHFDWYVTSIDTLFPMLPAVPGSGNMLYMNAGAGVFDENSNPAGVNSGGWGWGTVAVDLDHDGDQDLIATNGSASFNGAGVQEWLTDPTRVYRNRGNAVFDDIATEAGILHEIQGGGIALLDLENDSDLDVLIFNQNAWVNLYRSNASDLADANSLRVFVTAPPGHGVATHGLGARVTIVIDGMEQHRLLCAGSTYMSQSEMSAHFGLGAADRVDELRVEFPGGQRSILTHVDANQMLTVQWCPADWNGLDGVGADDLLAFLLDLVGGEADFDGDGVTNSTDLYAFLRSFQEGC